MKEEINKVHSDIHETDIKEEDYALTYNPSDVFDHRGRIEAFIQDAVHTSGSAICSGKYAGHGFSLKTYNEYRDCEWVIKKHIDWNNNVSQILIPLKKGAITHSDDVEKIAYRKMLRKIVRVENPDIETMKEHIIRLLNEYQP